MSINREAGERIVHAYTQAVGPMNYFVAQEIESAIRQGLTVANILEAIQITSFAPRPSAAYLRAVLPELDPRRGQPSPATATIQLVAKSRLEIRAKGIPERRF